MDHVHRISYYYCGGGSSRINGHEEFEKMHMERVGGGAHEAYGGEFLEWTSNDDFYGYREEPTLSSARAHCVRRVRRFDDLQCQY